MRKIRQLSAELEWAQGWCHAYITGGVVARVEIQMGFSLIATLSPPLHPKNLIFLNCLTWVLNNNVFLLIVRF